MSQVSQWPEIALDTETDGLRPYLGHRPFSLQMSDGKTAYYFPILAASGIDGDQVLGEKEKSDMRAFFAKTPKTWILQNAKFDLHHLHVAGFHPHEKSTFYDTAVLARLYDSSLVSYSMASLARLYLQAEQKSDAAMDYVKAHKLIVDDPGDIREGKKDKLVGYEKIPLEIMLPYAEQDVIVTFALYKRLMDLLTGRDKAREIKHTSCIPLIANEAKLVHTTWQMESNGIRIDRAYVKQGLEYAKDKISDGEKRFKEITGEDYVASSQRFIEILAARGISPDTFAETSKGNLQCDRKALERIGGEVALCILDIKDNKTRSNYFTTFLRFADSGDRIHTDFKQYGTVTGRFSSADPNLQNLKKADEDDPEDLDPFPIRRAFIPDDDCVLVMIDFAAMEYRMMLDYTKQFDLIEKVKAGLDLHQSTADLVGISRKHAKTLNFAILFGAGAGKIGGMLGITETEARDLIKKYYLGLPYVEKFIGEVKGAAKQRGYVTNWFGRRISYPDLNETFKAVNHIIQGGCADVMRIAMNGCHDLLECTRSQMNLTIHDELVFNIHRSEYDLVPQLADIMVKAYPYRRMPHAVEVSYSEKSLQDKIKGLPK